MTAAREIYAFFERVADELCDCISPDKCSNPDPDSHAPTCRYHRIVYGSPILRSEPTEQPDSGVIRKIVREEIDAALLRSGLYNPGSMR